jgi:AraC-like DNA-binding protein
LRVPSRRNSSALEKTVLLLDTAAVPVADRIEVFNAAMLDASVPMTITHEQPEQPIHARMHLWNLGPGEWFTSDNSGFRLRRAQKHLSMDGKPYLALALQATGLCRFEQFGHQQTVRRGHLMLNDLTAPYDVTWSGLGGSRCFQLPYDRLGLPADLIRAAVPRIHTSPLHDLVRHHLNYLSSEANRLQDDPGLTSLGNATTELLRALVVSAAAAGPDSLLRQVRQETLLPRILAYTRRHLTEPDLGPQRIASAHNISRRQLYTLFRHADISLEQWIITQRLDGARIDLTSPASQHRTIAAIARSWGFTSASHFTTRFHAAYGRSPSGYRQYPDAGRN